MAKITIINKKTIRRKLKEIGIPLLALGILYFAKPQINNAIKKYNNWRAYSSVISAIENKSYLESNQFLSLHRERLNAGQVSELEDKIKGVHPDKLIEKSKEITEPEEKVKLLAEAYQGYKLLGEEKSEIRKQYLETNLLNLTTYLKTKDASSKEVNKKLDNLLEDEIIFKVKEGLKPGTQTTFFDDSFTVDDNLTNEFFDAVAVYIKSFDAEAINKIETVIDKSTLFTEKLGLNDKKKEYATKLLEAYGKQTKNVLGSIRYDSVKLNALGSLKKLERKFEYKISSIDVDDTILKYIGKD